MPGLTSANKAVRLYDRPNEYVRAMESMATAKHKKYVDAYKSSVERPVVAGHAMLTKVKRVPAEGGSYGNPGKNQIVVNGRSYSRAVIPLLALRAELPKIVGTWMGTGMIDFAGQGVHPIQGIIIASTASALVYAQKVIRMSWASSETVEGRRSDPGASQGASDGLMAPYNCENCKRDVFGVETVTEFDTMNGVCKTLQWCTHCVDAKVDAFKQAYVANAKPDDLEGLVYQHLESQLDLFLGGPTSKTAVRLETEFAEKKKKIQEWEDSEEHKRQVIQDHLINQMATPGLLQGAYPGGATGATGPARLPSDYASDLLPPKIGPVGGHVSREYTYPKDYIAEKVANYVGAGRKEYCGPCGGSGVDRYNLLQKCSYCDGWGVKPLKMGIEVKPTVNPHVIESPYTGDQAYPYDDPYCVQCDQHFNERDMALHVHEIEAPVEAVQPRAPRKPAKPRKTVGGHTGTKAKAPVKVPQSRGANQTPVRKVGTKAVKDLAPPTPLKKKPTGGGSIPPPMPAKMKS